MLVTPEERSCITAALIPTTTVTGTERDVAQRVGALRDAGDPQFMVQIVPGQEEAIDDGARVKRACA